MRSVRSMVCGVLAACTSTGVTVPDEQVLYEVPPAGGASTSGGDDFTSTIEGRSNEGAPPAYASARRAGAAAVRAPRSTTTG